MIQATPIGVEAQFRTVLFFVDLLLALPYRRYTMPLMNATGNCLEKKCLYLLRFVSDFVRDLDLDTPKNLV
jgi:hypothetical protein